VNWVELGLEPFLPIRGVFRTTLREFVIKLYQLEFYLQMIYKQPSEQLIIFFSYWFGLNTLGRTADCILIMGE